MSGRLTRRAIAKEAAFIASSVESAAPQLSSPPNTPISTTADVKPKALSTKSKSKKTTSDSSKGKKAISTTPETKKSKISLKNEPAEPAPFPTPSSIHAQSPADSKASEQLENNQEAEKNESKDLSSKPAVKKRKRSVKEEDDEEDEGLPHNLGDASESEEEQENSDFEGSASQKPSAKKPAPKKAKITSPSQSTAPSMKDQKDADRSVVQMEKVKTKYAEDCTRREKTMKSGKKTKSETYGLSEGETPFPRWQHPTTEECQQVHNILSKHHPECKPQPKTVPEPSKFVAGCGEVRSILDALIRTRLSASTTSRNSSTAYQGMVKRYGMNKSGVGKGSVNYNAVRKAPVQDLFYAIKGGGLAVSKSADIKALLDIVFEDNQARRAELIEAETKKDNSKAPKGADVANDAQKIAEIKLAEDENLSLDHYYTLPTYEAIYKFMTFPGIGVKTAACVAMFCMQRPCFAVDTHVFRLAKWLGWVPPAEEKQKGDRPVDRDTTFSHLEVRVPDELKYMLHQLLIKHGKTCPRCRGNTGESSQGWSEGCVIDHLVQRSGPRKGGAESPAKTKSTSKTTKKSKAAVGSDNDDDGDEDMPDLHSDNNDAEEPSSSSSSSDGDASDYAPAKNNKVPTGSSRTKPTPSKATPMTTKASKASSKPTPAPAPVATIEAPNPKKSALKKSKRKPTPVNGWRGGRQVTSSSREPSTDV